MINIKIKQWDLHNQGKAFQEMVDLYQNAKKKIMLNKLRLIHKKILDREVLLLNMELLQIIFNEVKRN